ncbi:MAG TPA: hypothetical protein VGC42_01115 [Kofleriaceae bacterium]
MRASHLKALLLVVLASCGGGDSDTMAPDANEVAACVSSGRGDTYVAGLEKPGTGGLLDFKLMTADPSPPARFLNNWVVQVDAMTNGTPMDGVSMVVTPFMPDHQHGAGAYKVKVAPVDGASGQYSLTDINTWMPGYWEITIDATAGTMHDTAVYKFCIPE